MLRWCPHWIVLEIVSTYQIYKIIAQLLRYKIFTNCTISSAFYSELTQTWKAAGRGRAALDSLETAPD